MITSFEYEVQALKTAAERVGKEFDDPGEDWMGMAVFVGDNVTYLPLLFSNDDEKRFVATVAIPEVIRKVRPWFVGQIQSAWSVSLPRDPGLSAIETIETYQEMGIERPSEHPQREECLILVACSFDQIQMWQARIVRFENKPPALAPWTLWDAQPGATQGMFVDPIVETLKEVHGD